jgi:signal transduction histidine kinase
MTLQRLKWLAVLAPLLFLAAIEAVRQTIAPELFRGWPGSLLLGGVVLLATYFFAETIFGLVSRLQERLARQNRELLELHEASLGILAERDLQTVLQRVVDRARTLVGASYGAMALHEESGSATPPSGGDSSPWKGGAREGAGLGGEWTLVSSRPAGQTLRHEDLSAQGSSLTVPVMSHGRVLGNLALVEDGEPARFDADDEETLRRFATLAALAIENARLHRQIQALAVTEERERIAREMHDSLAQVLGYVNTKAQATEAFLERGQTEKAAAQLGQLSAAARAAYADVREGILGLRASPGEARTFIETLREYLTQWQEQSGVAVALVTDPAVGFAPRLTPHGEVQLLRIIQEALANVRKHAAATRAEVRLAVADGCLEVSVSDDGGGFDPDALGRTAVPRFGLATMRERAEAIGGTLSISSTIGDGTRVAAVVPIGGGEISSARPDR